MTKWIARHGDVPAFKITQPKKANLKKKSQVTVALGESTGHHHTLYADLEHDIVDGVHVVNLTTNTPLRHQQHKEIEIPKGFYAFGREVEYDPFLRTISQVQD